MDDTDSDIGFGTTLWFSDAADGDFTLVGLEITDVGPPGITNDLLEATNHKSPGRHKERVSGLRDTKATVIVGNLVRDEPMMEAMRAKVGARERTYWEVRIPESMDGAEDGETHAFFAYVTEFLQISPLPEVMTFSLTITPTGPVDVADTSATGPGVLKGPIAGHSAFKATVSKSRAVAGAISSGATFAAQITIGSGFSGLVAGQSALAATVSRTVSLSGSMQGSAAIGGAATSGSGLAGSLAASSTLAATPTLSRSLAGEMHGASVLAAATNSAAALAGSMSGAGAVVATPSLSVSLAGSVSALATLAATSTRSINLVASMVGQSTVTADATRAIAAFGVMAAAASFTGLATRAVSAAGAVSSAAAFSGTATMSGGGAPVITIASGSGYQGSTYSSTTPGQWTADGANIAGETGSTYVMSFANEGKAIRCGLSNTIEMWVPTDNANVLAVMDIRQGVSLAGASVTQWASQTGGLSGSQGTSAARPQYSATAWNGSPGMTFDGNDSLAGFVLAGTEAARTVVIGATPFDAGGVYSVLQEGNGAYQFRFESSNAMAVLSAATAQIGVSTGTTAAPSVFSCGYTNSYLAPLTFRQNGISKGNPQAQSTTVLQTQFNIGGRGGGGEQYYGVMSSFLVFNEHLSTADFTRAEGWVAWTTGQAGVLDASHPYKSAAPRLQ